MTGFLLPGDPDYLEDGVYLNLPAERYFPQGLGSTDLIKLWFQKEGWWWVSPYNRLFKRKTGKELLYGSGAHAIILEGVPAYEERFVAAPDWDRVKGLFDTMDAAKAELARQGFSAQSFRGLSKDELITAMLDADVEMPYKSLIEKRFADSIGEREIVSAEDDSTLRLLREVMLDPDRDDNAEIRAIFGDGGLYPAIVEVSIFHTLPNGVRRRWRIDRMWPAFDLDLKTLGNWSGRPLAWATGDMIAKGGYDIQRADYKLGRQIAYEYIKAGRLHGGTLEQREWLATWPARFPTWDWKWLFYQKPDSKTGRAPVLFPIHDDDDSEWEREGAVKARIAMQTFLRCRDRWGLDKPWARVEPLHYTDERHYPSRTVVFPHWIKTSELPTEGEAWEREER